jgi:hypothetical protein
MAFPRSRGDERPAQLLNYWDYWGDNSNSVCDALPAISSQLTTSVNNPSSTPPRPPASAGWLAPVLVLAPRRRWPLPPPAGASPLSPPLSSLACPGPSLPTPSYRERGARTGERPQRRRRGAWAQGRRRGRGLLALTAYRRTAIHRRRSDSVTVGVVGQPEVTFT